MVRDIESRPQPFGPRPIGDLDTAAVLLNQSGKAIIVFAYVWRYTKVDGTAQTSRFSNLGSSMQMDVLSGRSQAVRDLGSFILSGSKRLITEEGTFGNNLDVLQPHELPPHGAGYMAAGGGRGFGREISHERIGAVELSLDVAIFEDGLCVGPDEFGLFDSMTEGFERQRSAAEEAAKALRGGASEGQVFEILRPLAHHIAPPPGSGHRDPSSVTSIFANMAIHRLVHASASELLAWFEQSAKPASLHLRRPS